MAATGAAWQDTATIRVQAAVVVVAVVVAAVHTLTQ